MSKWSELPDQQTIEKTIAALKANGINAVFAETTGEAKQKVLSLIPSGAEVMTMSSTTNDSIGLNKEINESGKYNAIRDKLYSMDQSTQGKEMRKLGAVHDVTTGSVHAVTETGAVIIASATGSQLPAYAYTSGKVIWVVGAQKIVKNIEEGIKRIYEHTFPLEDQRARKVYGMGSGVNKMLIINKEVTPGRLHVIIVNQVLGF